MKVINCHKRIINKPEADVRQLFKTLATSEDMIWPKQHWPAIRFKKGLQIGSHGGHGRIRYTIIEINDDRQIKFQFTKPIGFDGTHELYIKPIDQVTTEITHNIEMNTTGIKATCLWVFMIRWLHDALIEDAFDNVENYFQPNNKRTRYSFWVKLLREFYKRKSSQINTA